MEFPTTVLIDLSTACNADCVMCPTQLNPLRKKLMDSSLFDDLVGQVAEFPRNDMFYIGVHGEPMLDKRLAAKIAICRAHGLTNVLISTNGSLMIPDRAREIIESRPHIVIISLESMNPGIYEEVRKGLSHEQTVENIKQFIAIRDAMNSSTRLGIRFIEAARNRDEKTDFISYWSAIINPAKGDWIPVDRIHNWAYGDPTKFHGNTPCNHTEATTILSDGSVVFCCLDHEGIHYLGNIHEHRLIDIFNNEKGQKLRAIHRARLRNTLPMCSTCDVAEQWTGQPMDPLYDDFKAADWVRLPAGV